MVRERDRPWQRILCILLIILATIPAGRVRSPVGPASSRELSSKAGPAAHGPAFRHEAFCCVKSGRSSSPVSLQRLRFFAVLGSFCGEPVLALAEFRREFLIVSTCWTARSTRHSRNVLGAKELYDRSGCGPAEIRSWPSEPPNR